MSKSWIIERFKDAKALVTDLAMLPIATPLNLYRSLRSGFDIFGSDLKAPHAVAPKAGRRVTNPKNPIVATMVVTGMELFKSSVGLAVAPMATLAGCDLVSSMIVGGLICKSLIDISGGLMGDTFAGTGAATMPRTAARNVTSNVQRLVA